jgi:hypothetical protein
MALPAMTCGMGLRPFTLSRFARLQSRGLGFDSLAFSITDGKMERVKGIDLSWPSWP